MLGSESQSHFEATKSENEFIVIVECAKVNRHILLNVVKINCYLNKQLNCDALHLTQFYSITQTSSFKMRTECVILL